MAQGESFDIFELDDDEDRRNSCSEAGTSNSNNIERRGGCSDVRHSMDPFRRAMPQMEADEDVCSICLDAFTEEDPGKTTTCGKHLRKRKTPPLCRHTFHLQCIMQWAQRSRECPLCFKALALQDPDLQALLPFGEYVPHDHSSLAASALLGIESWDVDRLLQRLALQNSTAGNRRQRARSRPFSLSENPHIGSRMASAESSGNNRSSNQASSSQMAEASFPSSWPPSGASLPDRRNSGESEGTHRSRSGAPVDLKAAGEGLRARWSNFQSRWRESLSKSTSGLRSKLDKTQQPSSPSDVHQHPRQ